MGTGIKLFDYTSIFRGDGYRVFFGSDKRFITADDESFHLFFNEKDGTTAKWGRTLKDDPTHCPWGNEIADIEITTSCRGIRKLNADGTYGDRSVCKFCYKSNQPNGTYMSFDTFKKIFDVLNQPKTMTQIAFGVDAECETNPDTWKIFDYCRENGVTPNLTVADITQATAEKIVARCGACAVSAYEANKHVCYDSVKLLIDESIRQGKKDFRVNIHALVSAETFHFLNEVIDDVKNDDRLKGLNAIVFLSLKQKGRGESFHKVTDDQFKELVGRCFEMGIGFGMDSCSAPKFLMAIKDRPDVKELTSVVEPCESLMNSIFINVKGEVFPCSFLEGDAEWGKGIDMLGIKNFSEEVWNGALATEYRNKSICRIKCNGFNSCRHYDV